MVWITSRRVLWNSWLCSFTGRSVTFGYESSFEGSDWQVLGGYEWHRRLSLWVFVRRVRLWGVGDISDTVRKHSKGGVGSSTLHVHISLHYSISWILESEVLGLPYPSLKLTPWTIGTLELFQCIRDKLSQNSKHFIPIIDMGWE